MNLSKIPALFCIKFLSKKKTTDAMNVSAFDSFIEEFVGKIIGQKTQP